MKEYGNDSVLICFSAVLALNNSILSKKAMTCVCHLNIMFSGIYYLNANSLFLSSSLASFPILTRCSQFARVWCHAGTVKASLKNYQCSIKLIICHVCNIDMAGVAWCHLSLGKKFLTPLRRKNKFVMTMSVWIPKQLTHVHGYSSRILKYNHCYHHQAHNHFDLSIKNHLPTQREWS